MSLSMIEELEWKRRQTLKSPVNEEYTHTHTHTHLMYAAAGAKLLQSCPNLCNPIDGSPPGSPVPGNLQARTLEWVAISFYVHVNTVGLCMTAVRRTKACYYSPPKMCCYKEIEEQCLGVST